MQWHGEVAAAQAIGNLIDQPVVVDEVAEQTDLGLDVLQCRSLFGRSELLLE